MHSVIFGELLQECVVFVFCNLIVYEYLEHYRVEVTVIFWSFGGFVKVPMAYLLYILEKMM